VIFVVEVVVRVLAHPVHGCAARSPVALSLMGTGTGQLRLFADATTRRWGCEPPETRQAWREGLPSTVAEAVLCVSAAAGARAVLPAAPLKAFRGLPDVSQSRPEK